MNSGENQCSVQKRQKENVANDSFEAKKMENLKPKGKLWKICQYPTTVKSVFKLKKVTKIWSDDENISIYICCVYNRLCASFYLFFITVRLLFFFSFFSFRWYCRCRLQSLLINCYFYYLTKQCLPLKTRYCNQSTNHHKFHVLQWISYQFMVLWHLCMAFAAIGNRFHDFQLPTPFSGQNEVVNAL